MKKLIIACILNLFFSLFEFFGGLFSGSTAIFSDALHDFGDALSMGISLLLEKKSQKPADEKYNFGYRRFSLLGGLITYTVLLIGSFFAFFNGMYRLFNPITINVELMLIFAVFGFLVNLIAVLLTHKSHTHNRKAINLHILEDLLGWLTVLFGTVIMKFTDITFIDPLLSIIISVFIFVSSFKETKEIFAFFLLKCPVPYKKVEEALKNFNYSSLKIFAIDESNVCAYLQVYKCNEETKSQIKKALKPSGITCVIIENKKF